MDKVEIVVVGAGPAGLSAAIEAAKLGCEVLVLDENQKAGGQLFKQIHKFFGSRDQYAGMRGFEIAKQLEEGVSGAGVGLDLESTVFGLFEDNLVGYSRGGKAHSIKAGAIILATGAKERSIVFPGWTLPGVMGAGAAQTLVNMHRVLPGRKILMVGSGNVGLIISYQLLQAGAEVVAVIEQRRRVGGYDVHYEKLTRAGIPVLTSHTIKQAWGENRLKYAEIGQVDRAGTIISGSEKLLEVDVVCLAIGLSPLAELAWMAGCGCMYLPELGGYVPIHDTDMQTSKKGLYVAGDIAGIEEASTAMEEGKLAGLSAAESLERGTAGRIFKAKSQIKARLEQLRHGPMGEQRQRARQKMNATSLSEEESSMAAPCGEKIRKRVEPTERTIQHLQPSKKRLSEGPVAVIHCKEEIPCNPCEFMCLEGAITIGHPLTNLPVFSENKCNGCKLCIAHCPGLAIFVVDQTYSEEQAIVHLPYEFSPLPAVGEDVDVVSANGAVIGNAKVKMVRNPPKFNRTAVISIAAPKAIAMEIRSIKTASSPPLPYPRPKTQDPELITDYSSLITNTVCRCEEIEDAQIEDAIKRDARSFRTIKNRTRTGMGLCQGRACSDVSLDMLIRNTGVSAGQIPPPSVRPPVRPIELGILAKGVKDD